MILRQEPVVLGKQLPRHRVPNLNLRLFLAYDYIIVKFSVLINQFRYFFTTQV